VFFLLLLESSQLRVDEFFPLVVTQVGVIPIDEGIERIRHGYIQSH
jgi:hypothetical protein